MLLRLSIFLLSLGLCARVAPAQLLYRQFSQEFQCTPEQKSAEAHFAFKNGGTTPVTIKEMRPSCGCTTAKLEKRTYAPGETGEITVIYSFRGQTGALRKTVSIFTDDRKEPVLLEVRVFRHEPFELKPSLVYWRTGAPAEARTVTLKANHYPVHIKSVTSSNPRLTAKLATVKEGEEYAVSVTPADTAQKETGEIVVVTDFPTGAPRSYTIQARIK